MKNSLAFSLIELSMVLVILGLLTGGILAGKSLIRASELRGVGTELQQWNTAVYAFKDKYFMLPGDITNAQSIWGTGANCPGTTAQPSTDATTCNGNGNGLIEVSLGGMYGDEYFRFWQHLSNAGLIAGRFTGVTGPGGAFNSVAGSNVPASKLSTACWSAISAPASVGSTSLYDMPAGNQWSYGAQHATGSCKNSILLPSELWNIDTKNDDGLPGTGKIRSRTWTLCTLATSSSDFVHGYDVSSTSLCAMQMPMSF